VERRGNEHLAPAFRSTPLTDPKKLGGESPGARGGNRNKKNFLHFDEKKRTSSLVKRYPKGTNVGSGIVAPITEENLKNH